MRLRAALDAYQGNVKGSRFAVYHYGQSDALLVREIDDPPSGRDSYILLVFSGTSLPIERPTLASLIEMPHGPGVDIALASDEWVPMNSLQPLIPF